MVDEEDGRMDVTVEYGDQIPVEQDMKVFMDSKDIKIPE